MGLWSGLGQVSEQLPLEQHEVGGLAVRNDVSGQGQRSGEEETDVRRFSRQDHQATHPPTPTSAQKRRPARLGAETSGPGEGSEPVCTC